MNYDCKGCLIFKFNRDHEMHSQLNIALQYCNQNCKNTIINIIRVILIKQTMKKIKKFNYHTKYGRNVEDISWEYLTFLFYLGKSFVHNT